MWVWSCSWFCADKYVIYNEFQDYSRAGAYEEDDFDDFM